MKNKTLWIGLIIIIVLIFGIIIINKIQIKKDLKPFKYQEFENTVNIINNTDYERIDTVLFVLSEQIFEFDTLNIKLFYVPKHLKNSQFDYYAIVQKIPFDIHTYFIFLKKDLKLHELKSILSHEFIHIDQYEKGDLYVYSDYALYKGEYIHFSTVEYKNRSYEIEAFNNQNKILKKLNNLLY